MSCQMCTEIPTWRLRDARTTCWESTEKTSKQRGTTGDNSGLRSWVTATSKEIWCPKLYKKIHLLFFNTAQTLDKHKKVYDYLFLTKKLLEYIVFWFLKSVALFGVLLNTKHYHTLPHTTKLSNIFAFKCIFNVF